MFIMTITRTNMFIMTSFILTPWQRKYIFAIYVRFITRAEFQVRFLYFNMKTFTYFIKFPWGIITHLW